MKLISVLLVLALLSSCQQTQQKAGTAGKSDQQSTGRYGKDVLPGQAVAAVDLFRVFTVSDTVETIISGKIIASCRHTGCWMDLDMGNGESVHVTFFDESFTIPLDAAGKNAVAEGMAYRELIPVKTQQNYAREDGKNEEEIAAITEPVYAYEFIARGVLIEE